jgi:N-acetylglutamate synthase
MRYRYENRLHRGDVGSRVVVRRWVEDEERGQVPSDVLGVLEAWSDDGVLTIRRRDDTIVTVDEATILAAKTVG